MGASDWMVPNLTDSEDLELRGQELALIQSAANAPEFVGSFAASLLRQNAMWKSIVSQASRRIAELELREAVGQHNPVFEAFAVDTLGPSVSVD